MQVATQRHTQDRRASLACTNLVQSVAQLVEGAHHVDPAVDQSWETPPSSSRSWSKTRVEWESLDLVVPSWQFQAMAKRSKSMGASCRPPAKPTYACQPFCACLIFVREAQAVAHPQARLSTRPAQHQQRGLPLMEHVCKAPFPEC